MLEIKAPCEKGAFFIKGILTDLEFYRNLILHYPESVFFMDAPNLCKDCWR